MKVHKLSPDFDCFGERQPSIVVTKCATCPYVEVCYKIREVRALEKLTDEGLPSLWS